MKNISAPLHKNMSKFNKILSSAASLGKARVFNRHLPLFVSWELTNRCNLKCRYCDVWKLNSEELPTDTVLSMVDELKNLGTKFISFTGGEPLLRKDIDEILSHCKTNGLYASLNSNGFELKDKPQTVKKFDFVIMSLDGQEAIHDYIR